MKIYVIGSLRNPRVRQVAKELRDAGYDVFDDWHACHEDADDWWRGYELHRGRGYAEALDGLFLQHNLDFDKRHLDRADVVILVASKEKIGGFSAGIELAYARGNGKPVYVLLDGDPQRWDMMLVLITNQVYYDLNDILKHIGEQEND